MRYIVSLIAVTITTVTVTAGHDLMTVGINGVIAIAASVAVAFGIIVLTGIRTAR